MPREKKTPEQQLNELDQLQAQIKAKRQKLTAKINGQERKNDTRRKIIAGALALEHGNADSAFTQKLNALIDEYVTSDKDRALFGLGAKEIRPSGDLQNV